MHKQCNHRIKSQIQKADDTTNSNFRYSLVVLVHNRLMQGATQTSVNFKIGQS